MPLARWSLGRYGKTICDREVKGIMSRSAFLRLELAVSLALVALALGWASARELSLAARFSATPYDLAVGVAVGALLWLCIPLLVSHPGMRRLWNAVLVPFARGLGLGDVALIALLSGFSEELFFRGVLLPEIGLVASSLLFGLLHALNPVYAMWAAITGAVFGVLAIHGETLVAPMLAHATYNFGALLALRRWRLGTPVPEGETST